MIASNLGVAGLRFLVLGFFSSSVVQHLFFAVVEAVRRLAVKVLVSELASGCCAHCIGCRGRSSRKKHFNTCFVWQTVVAFIECPRQYASAVISENQNSSRLRRPPRGQAAALPVPCSQGIKRWMKLGITIVKIILVVIVPIVIVIRLVVIIVIVMRLGVHDGSVMVFCAART